MNAWKPRVALLVISLAMATAWVTECNLEDQAAESDPWDPWVASGSSPSFDGATGWINAVPQALPDLRGRVVLVDFWSYSCANCMRTVPYVRDWAQKYRAQGLVVIGVHTPAIDHEPDIQELKRITRLSGIKFPVAIDDGRRIWKAFGNHARPGLYFIDHRGRIADVRYGEGSYVDSERVLQALLREAGAVDIPTDLVKPF